MSKSKIITIVIIVAVILIGGFLFYVGNHTIQNNQVTVNDNKTVSDAPLILGNKDDLVSFSVSPNVKVHGVLSYRGVIKGGYFFEGNILINILDANKKILKRSNAVAKSDWMTTGPVNFEGNIDFTGLPKGSAYFEIHNDNASGLPANDKSILIPIIIN